MSGRSPTAANPSSIQGMFASIAPRYDRANTVLSMGMHGRWKRHLVAAAGDLRGRTALDLATGTGDVARLVAAAVGPEGQVVGADFCEPMMAVARARAPDPKSAPIRWVEADAMALPFEDASFDAAFMSFGLRNVAEPAAALAELARVVRPGGFIGVLEFGQPPRPSLLDRLARWYVDRVVPIVGGLVTGQGWAYRYLQDSAGHFPGGEAFLARFSAPDGPIGQSLELQKLDATLGKVAFLYALRRTGRRSGAAAS